MAHTVRNGEQPNACYSVCYTLEGMCAHIAIFPPLCALLLEDFLCHDQRDELLTELCGKLEHRVFIMPEHCAVITGFVNTLVGCLWISANPQAAIYTVAGVQHLKYGSALSAFVSGPVHA